MKMAESVSSEHLKALLDDEVDNELLKIRIEIAREKAVETRTVISAARELIKSYLTSKNLSDQAVEMLNNILSVLNTPLAGHSTSNKTEEEGAVHLNYNEGTLTKTNDGGIETKLKGTNREFQPKEINSDQFEEIQEDKECTNNDRAQRSTKMVTVNSSTSTKNRKNRNTKSSDIASLHHCSICNKGFKLKHHMVNHKIGCSGQRPFKCEQCGKDFSLLTTLTLHQKIHTGEKPFQCLVCDKRFRKKDGYTRQQLINSGEKPHKCELCEKAFVQKGGLATHMKVHFLNK